MGVDLGASSQWEERSASDSLGLFPVVRGDLLVIAALAAIQRGPIHRQRQLLLRPGVRHRGLVVFWRTESEMKVKTRLHRTTDTVVIGIMG